MPISCTASPLGRIGRWLRRDGERSTREFLELRFAPGSLFFGDLLEPVAGPRARRFEGSRVSGGAWRKGKHRVAGELLERRRIVALADFDAASRAVGRRESRSGLQQAARQAVLGPFFFEPGAGELPVLQRALGGLDHPGRFARVAILLFLERGGEIVATNCERAQGGRPCRQSAIGLA